MYKKYLGVAIYFKFYIMLRKIHRSTIRKDHYILSPKTTNLGLNFGESNKANLNCSLVL